MQIISIIVAFDEKRGIGKKGTLPWRLPRDLAHFKSLTIHHSIIMGRKTYESIGRPLPERKNIVITRNQEAVFPGCTIAHSLIESLSLAGEGEVFIIGGSEIYREALPLADNIYTTQIEGDFECDAFFPEIHSEDWQKEDEVFYEKDDKNERNMEFVRYKRIKAKLENKAR